MLRMRALIVILGCLWAGLAMGQETLLSDPIPPFEGRISYRISYSGKTPKDIRKDLPDSLVIWVKPPHIRIKFYGQLSDTLMNEVHWSTRDESFLLFDHPNETVYALKDGFQQDKPRKIKSSQSRTILGHPCKSYILTTAKTKDQVWINDSIYFPLPEPDTTPGFRPPFLLAGISGLPLRHVRTRAQRITTTVAVEIVRGILPDEKFRLPGGYSRKEFEPRVMRHSVIGNTQR